MHMASRLNSALITDIALIHKLGTRITLIPQPFERALWTQLMHWDTGAKWDAGTPALVTRTTGLWAM